MGQLSDQDLGSFIDGHFQLAESPDDQLNIISPANLKDSVFQCGFSYKDIDRACKSAQKAYKSWKNIPQEERNEYLSRVRELYLAYEEPLSKAISRETGKPLWESRQEVKSMASKVTNTLEDSLPLVREQRIENIQPNVTGVTRFRSKGVMAVIGPFNFPGHLPNGHIVPALITGNTVVFKPSDKTPLVGQLMAQIFEEAGLPPGVFNLVQGSAEMGKRLVSNEHVDSVLFTGSYNVGLKIKQETLNQHWKTLALEMGGKNSSIVWADADLKRATYESLVASFISSGQRCTCTSRLFVHERIYDKFLEGFYESAKKIRVGHWDEEVFMGPLISQFAQENYIRFQEIAKREGAKSVMRGKTLNLENSGYYVTPSICEVEDFDPKSIYQKTELFGPNVAFYKIKDGMEEKIFDMINGPGFGLAMSVFSKDRSLYEKAFSEVNVGVINWNKATTGASSKLPFGGVGKSGNDRPSALYAVNYCTTAVASLEDEGGELDLNKYPGLKI